MLTRNRERLIGYHVIESRQWCLCEPCHDVFIFSQLGPLCGPLESYKSVLLPQLWHQATPSRSPWNRKGTEIETDIFVGVVYYQRLRHLVMDKAQVRARGSLDERRQRGNNSVAKGRKVEVICRLQILNDFEETRIKESSIHVFFFEFRHIPSQLKWFLRGYSAHPVGKSPSSWSHGPCQRGCEDGLTPLKQLNHVKSNVNHPHLGLILQVLGNAM